MKMRSLTLIALTALAAVGAACGATSNGGTPTSTTPPTSPTPSTSIHDIQSGVISSNSTVTLSGIVVTGVKPGGNGIDFWAQDAGGGQYSGIYFFDKNNHTDLSIAVGDVVTVTGQYQEYYQAGSTFSLSEIVPSTMTIDSPGGGTPVASDVTTADLKNGVAEPWEGCLVNVTGSPAVTSLSLGFGEYGIGTEKIHVDKAIYDSFYPRIQDELVTKLVGLVDYGFKNFHVDPRSVDDITTNGTNTPMSTTMNGLLSSAPKSGQLVTVTNVTVSALAPYTTSGGAQEMSFWAQDGATASTSGGFSSGMYFNDVFHTNPAVVPGKTVSLTGKLIVFGTTTLAHEIDFGYQQSPTLTLGNGTVPTPAIVQVVRMKGAVAASYENQLIKVMDAGMKVQTVDATHHEYSFGTSATDFIWVGTFGGVMTDSGKVAGTTNIGSGQGPVYYDFGKYFIEPQAAGDVVVIP